MAELPVVDPATGAEVARVSCMDAQALADALARARAAQPAWAATPLDERLAALGRFADLLGARRNLLADILTSETGKPVRQARAEIAATRARVAFFRAESPGVLAPETVTSEPGLTEEVTREPLGVIANLSAWNYPYFVGANVFVPALLCGNAVLYKPSEYALLTGQAITGLLHEAGVPRDLMICAAGDGATGRALLDQPVDGAFFTGSCATGRTVAKQLAGRLIPLQLELGGKDPVYVCEDVDPARAAASLAEGAFYNSGQSCCAVERIYVHAASFAAFVASFHERVSALRRGDPRDPDTDIGPLTRRAQLEQLEAQIADALGRGARVICGGARVTGPGNFFEPTVLLDVDHSMAVMRDETFGPLVGVMAVRDDEEAVARMADTEYGLTAGVYSANESRARALLARLDTGSSYWNCCDRISPRLPWSGRRASGMGTTLGADGIRAMTRPRAWHLRAPS